MMYFTNPLSSSPTTSSSSSLIFPTFLVPSIPFRRRKSSTESTGTVSSATGTTADEPSYLANNASTLRCSTCLADLCPTTSIISKGFTGRHGRAYLVGPSSPSSAAFPPRRTSTTSWMRHPRDAGNLPNTTLDKAVPRQLVTGAHTVADLRCGMCDAVLGWKYVAAEEAAQQYKVGKFILETKRVCRGVDWESGAHDDLNELGAGGAADVPDEIEFDSQDEDECEDLFAGVWTPALARKRREKKRAMWGKDGQDDMV